MICDDLRLGGTKSSAGISGGVSINSTALAVNDWAGIFGIAGFSTQALEVSGRPGVTYAGDNLGRGRFFNLDMKITRYGPNLTLTEPTGDEQIVENTDDFLSLLLDPSYLEVDLPDGSSRFIPVRNLDPSYFRTFERSRTISVPLVSSWPFWSEGGTEQSDTIASADTVTVGGEAPIYDAVLVFAGDGTFTHSGLGWAIEVTGSGGAVTVDLGARTVVEGGNPAQNRIRRTPASGAGPVWGWFTTGSNSVTSDVSVVVTWRDQWV